MSRHETCGRCNGTGRLRTKFQSGKWETITCYSCRGTGADLENAIGEVPVKFKPQNQNEK